jgi:hypothetical protein
VINHPTIPFCLEDKGFLDFWDAGPFSFMFASPRHMGYVGLPVTLCPQIAVSMSSTTAINTYLFIIMIIKIVYLKK